MSRIAYLRGWRLVTLLAVLVAAVGIAAGSSLAAGSAPRTQLVVAEEDIAPSLDLDGSNAGHPGTEAAVINLMETLVAYPSKKTGDVLVPNYKVGPFQFEPRLATSWTKKGLVWTMKLRKGVKSCAGNELTADDVIWTFQRAKSVSGASPVSWFLSNVSGILGLEPLTSKDPNAKVLKGEVVKVDDYTVRFTQMHPNELFPRTLEIFALSIFDSKEVKKHVTAADPWAHKWVDTVNSPGFGPYCLTKWNKGSEMDLTANPNYYRGQPQFKNIVWRRVPSTSNRVGAIETGSADVVTHLSPTEFAAVAKSNSKAKVLTYSNNIVLFVGLSYKFAPWSVAKNKLLRQAVAYAIPYDDIIAKDYLGGAKRLYGLCESSYYGYVAIPKYKTDMAKAKALLAQAGFPGGKGLPTAGLTLYFVAERRSLMEPIANRIRTSLAQLGINITLAPISNTEYTDRRLTKYDMPMFMDDGDRPLGPDVGYCSLLWYVSKAKGGLVTDSSYSNPKFDALYAKSSTTVGAPRAATLKQMQQILIDELPKIPIVEPASQLAIAKDLTNWQSTTYDIPYFWSLKTTS